MDQKLTALQQLLGIGEPVPAAPPQKTVRKKPSARPSLPRKPIFQRPAGSGGW
jgi:hypothetical protein